MRRFTYLQMTVLITRASPTFRADCIDASRKMLSLLPDMVSDSEEPYNGIIWMLVCCPFTPLLVLFGEILANGQGPSEANQQSLEAMEKVPAYLRAMGFRNTLAKKLIHIAETLVMHANAAVQSQGRSDKGPKCLQLVPLTDCSADSAKVMMGPTFDAGDGPQRSASLDMSADWDLFFDHALQMPAPDASQQYDLGRMQLDDLGFWSTGDANIDWIAWDSQLGAV